MEYFSHKNALSKQIDAADPLNEVSVACVSPLVLWTRCVLCVSPRLVVVAALVAIEEESSDADGLLRKRIDAADSLNEVCVVCVSPVLLWTRCVLCVSPALVAATQDFSAGLVPGTEALQNCFLFSIVFPILYR